VISAIRKWALRPGKFDMVRDVLKRPGATVLDVGCGNHSPTVTKSYFPECRYFGIDIVRYNNDEADMAAMEKYWEMDIDQVSNLDQIDDDFFDCILLNHIVEHTRNGNEILSKLCRKLRSGGVIYVETPSEKSKTLPSMKGTLNFYDDPTHVRVYSIGEMSEVVSKSECTIVHSGMRRSAKRILLLPLYAIASFFRFGHLRAVVFWDLLGFAHYVMGQRTGVAETVKTKTLTS